jgi:hypothetical protein
MKFCIKCGTAREGAFCSDCGFKFPNVEGQSPASETGAIRIDFSESDSASVSSPVTEAASARQSASERIIYPGLVYGEGYVELKNCANCGATTAGGQRCEECAPAN